MDRLKVRAHVIVNGKVQGVFFRSETRFEAKKRGVNGWVRNLPDGRVEAVFEGEETNVKELIEFCRKGPPGAKVTSVEVSWEKWTGEFKSFEIRSGWSF
ncbi:MAG: acylphosphatase [Candidatus Bathyarchaeia archaeon]